MALRAVKAVSGPVLSKELRNLIDSLEPGVSRSFSTSVRDTVDGIDFQALVKAIAEGDVDKAVAACDVEQAAFAPLRDALRTSFKEAGDMTATLMPKPPRPASR